MKRTVWTRILAVLLVVCMMAPSVSAAGWGSWGSNASTNGWGDWFRGIWDQIIGTIGGGEEEEPVVEEEQELVLIEDASTVENGDMLRASTYALTTASEADAVGTNAAETQADTSTTLKYFPITLYDYDDTTINNATHQVEVDAGLSDKWNGIYFSGGSPSPYSSANISYNRNNNYSEYINTTYYYKSGDNYYQITSLSCSTRSVWFSTSYTWTIGYIGYKGTKETATVNGNPLSVYRLSNSIITTKALPYADWNWWNKNSSSDTNGQKTYTGLVSSSLDSNKDIVFTKPDGGIFNSDAAVKSIYTNVEMPFVYNKSNGTYTFDASKNGVYFHKDSTQGSAGTAASNTRLYFNEGNTQSNGGNYGDGSSTVWAPFNDGTSFSESKMNYHFGMRTTIPFTMTSNGRMDAGDNNSDAIQFSFSGDDDVWVFIDGQLVVDLGGIHNRLDVTINFAANTVVYSESNDSDAEIGSYNDPSFATTQTLFGNLISQDRTTFAATDSHELTIFYLERGAGSSNCKIEFNLPMKDVVTVRKIVDGQMAVDENGNTAFEDLSDLTADQLTVLNNLNFGFTIYKNDAPWANATYNLLSANGQVISTPSTDSSGHFYLKNGQTAKFVGEFDNTDGDNYYVVEDIKDGFIYTTYSATAEAAGGASISNDVAYSYYKESGAYYVTDTDYSTLLASGTYHVIGGSESEDALAIVCKNYMNASLPRPSAIPNDDKVVIDYGLSVEADITANDYHLGDSHSYSIDTEKYPVNGDVYTATYGTFTLENGKITYTLNKQLTGVEVIEYIMSAYATAENGETITATGTAKVYIIPATTMYYEEDFAGLVTYTGGSSSGWSTVGNAQTDAQEPGVVGTVGDSPYGSDVAYLYDSGDSNGSSKHVDTTNGAAKFSYTFTGTGTSFFARTTSNTGYLRIVVAGGEANQTIYRDTVYKGTDTDTLYNIPVFTTDGLAYGTYTVTVTVAKQNTKLGYKSEFWLDGIRVYQPLNEGDANVAVATGAYATDGEANMANVTLRNKLLGEADLDEEDNPVWKEGGNFVLFTDVDGELDTAEEYKSIGPKEEVYLNEGQSVTFSLYDWDPNTNKVYLGIKAPFGSGMAKVGSTTLTISNAADCYYDITSYGAVTTDEDGVKTVTFAIASTDNLISLTNIKVTGNAKFTIVSTGVDEDYPGSQN